MSTRKLNTPFTRVAHDSLVHSDALPNLKKETQFSKTVFRPPTRSSRSLSLVWHGTRTYHHSRWSHSHIFIWRLSVVVDVAVVDVVVVDVVDDDEFHANYQIALKFEKQNFCFSSSSSFCKNHVELKKWITEMAVILSNGIFRNFTFFIWTIRIFTR